MGIVCGAALGGGVAALCPQASVLPVLPLGLAASAVSQGGDLFESWLKRRAGVKDSSWMIPRSWRCHGPVGRIHRRGDLRRAFRPVARDRLGHSQRRRRPVLLAPGLAMSLAFAPVAQPKRLNILGATGSIGRSTEAVILHAPGRFEVVAVAGGRDARNLARVAKSLNARFAAIADPAFYAELKAELSGSGIEAGAGAEALAQAATSPADLVIGAIAGAAGVRPTFAALEAGLDVALANKECLVCAGEAFMRTALRRGVTVLPMEFRA